MSISRHKTNNRMSQCVVHGDTVYLAGQVAQRAPGGSVSEQTRAILAQIDELLIAGTDKTKALTATIWLCSMDDFAEMNAVWDEWSKGGHAPCRACVESPRLATPDYTVEIGIIAQIANPGERLPMADTATLAIETEFELIENLPFTTESAIGHRARIGLIVLASDYTIEHEFRNIFKIQGVDFYESRIMNSMEISPETLAAMAPAIAETANRILPGDTLDVVAFGCTSASMVLGEGVVSKYLRKAKPGAKTTNPITAAFAAFDALGAKRIAVLTPYQRSVNQVVRAYIVNAGYQVPVFGSFNEPMDPVVASIDGNSIKSAIHTITKNHDVDAVFVSCTSVRLVDAIEEIEAEAGLPVTSSNHAMAWHCLRLAGIDDKLSGLGRLFENY